MTSLKKVERQKYVEDVEKIRLCMIHECEP